MGTPTETEMEKLDGGTGLNGIERSVRAALETYANVHRGSGHHSRITTHLYERARDVVLAHLGLPRRDWAVIFGSPRRVEALAERLPPEAHRVVSSAALGLPLGVRALVARRDALPDGPPPEAGGGAAKLVSRGWVIWADGEERFEAGTPSILGAIALAAALRPDREPGADGPSPPPLSTADARDLLLRDSLDHLEGGALLEALAETRVGGGALVPTAGGPRRFVNLDNAASTPTFEPIWDAFLETWRRPEPARREVVREARAICAEALGAPAEEYDVLFTANTTEAIHLAAEGLGREARDGAETVVLATLLEHSSNDLPWRAIPGGEVARLPVDAEGFVDPAALEATLRAYNEEGAHGAKRIRVVAASGASNVLGACNDLAEMCRIAHRYGARLLVDAAQLVAHRPIDVAAAGIDYLAFSGHKVYAPFGAGALVVRRGLLGYDPTELAAIRASAEENAPGIAALAKALVLLRRIGMGAIEAAERDLTARLVEGLARIRGVRLYGVSDPSSPRFVSRLGVVSFDVAKRIPTRLAEELAERAGIGVRAGCHCAHLLVKRLAGVGPFLERVQWLIQRLFPRLKLPGVLRASLGLENRAEDVDRLLAAIEELASGAKADPREAKAAIDALVLSADARVYGSALPPAVLPIA